MLSCLPTPQGPLNSCLPFSSPATQLFVYYPALYIVHFMHRFSTCVNRWDKWGPVSISNNYKECDLICMCAQSLIHVQLCNPMCSPPGSPIHGILQARTLGSTVISYSRKSSQPRDWTVSVLPALASGFFTPAPTRKPCDLICACVLSCFSHVWLFATSNKSFKMRTHPSTQSS